MWRDCKKKIIAVIGDLNLIKMFNDQVEECINTKRDASDFQYIQLFKGMQNIVEFQAHRQKSKDNRSLNLRPITNPALITSKFIQLCRFMEANNMPDSVCLKEVIMSPDTKTDFIDVNIVDNFELYHQMRNRVFERIKLRFDEVSKNLSALTESSSQVYESNITKAIHKMKYLMTLELDMRIYVMENDLDFEFLDVLENAIRKMKSQVAQHCEPARQSEPAAKCPRCGFLCGNMKEMVEHFSIEHFPSNFKYLQGTSCPDCSSPRFETRDELFKHVALIHNKIKVNYVSWICEVCNIILKEQHAMVYHLEALHNKKRSEGKLHMRMIIDKYLKCPLCPQVSDFEGMKTHMYLAHYAAAFKETHAALANRISCPYCTCYFDFSESLYFHCATHHNLIYKFMLPISMCTIQIVADKSVPSVNLVPEENVIIVEDDSMQMVEETLLTDPNDPLADPLDVDSEEDFSTKQKKRQDSLEYCRICKKNLLKKKFTQHVVTRHFQKELENEMADRRIDYSKINCQLCGTKQAEDFTTHFALKHSWYFPSFFATNFLDGKPAAGQESEEGAEIILDEQATEDDGFSQDSLAEIYSEEEDTDNDTKMAGADTDSPWVQKFKLFCKKNDNLHGAKEMINMNFTIINPSILDIFLQKITTTAENIAKLDTIVNELEAVASITLALLPTVKRHLLLKEYLKKCEEVQSNIFQLSSIQIVIFLSQTMVKPRIEKDDMVWLIKKISSIHEPVDGKPLGMNKKVLDFFSAIGSPLDPSIFLTGVKAEVGSFTLPNIRCNKCNKLFKTNKALSVHTSKNSCHNGHQTPAGPSIKTSKASATPAKNSPSNISPASAKAAKAETSLGYYECPTCDKYYNNRKSLKIHWHRTPSCSINSGNGGKQACRNPGMLGYRIPARCDIC